MSRSVNAPLTVTGDLQVAVKLTTTAALTVGGDLQVTHPVPNTDPNHSVLVVGGQLTVGGNVQVTGGDLSTTAPAPVATMSCPGNRAVALRSIVTPSKCST
jgi:hypothetical protein